MAKREKKEKQPKAEKYQYEHSSARIGKKVAAVEGKRRASIILIALLILALFITGIIYTVLYFVETNSFRIGVDESSIGGLSLADEYNFTYPKTYLSMGGPEKMDNTTYKMLDLKNILASEGGSMNGSNYIAFTFYVRNDGDVNISYLTEITIESETKRLGDAVRVLVKKGDADISYYARAKEDGTPEKLVPYKFNPADANDLEMIYDAETAQYVKGTRKTSEIDATPFYDDNPNGRSIIMSRIHENFAPKAIQAFTVVVWLEGEDGECVDEVLGGKMRLEMKLAVDDGTISVTP